ncbi:MAG: photosynthetic complex putative assembly protein PuhB [Paracoccaceae bacterium]
MSNHDHDDFAVEPLPGLPAQPPKGEVLLWQGRPRAFALAREALKINWIAGYFVALAVWRGWAMGGGVLGTTIAVMLPYLAIGLLTCAILMTIAVVQARSTVYTITSARVAMRIGVALTVTLNLPFRQIGAANLALKSNGTGTIALQTLGDTRISYLVCWPHVRPWHFNRTQPALRAIPDAAAVAKILAEAAETRLNQPVITQNPGPAHAVAAE